MLNFLVTTMILFTFLLISRKPKVRVRVLLAVMTETPV